MKNTKTIVMFVVVAVIIAGGIWYILGYKGSQKGQSNSGDVVEALTTRCRKLHVDLLLSIRFLVQKFLFPFTVSGIVNNTKYKELGCSWGVFEAVAGTIQVKDETGKVISNDAPFTTNNQDWMTDPSSVYTGTLLLEDPGFKGKANYTLYGRQIAQDLIIPIHFDIPIIIK
jgi:hypothetical protein